MKASCLPAPHLVKRTIDTIPLFTDDALLDASSVRICFTGRAGGTSEGAYASLNLGTHVNDDPAAVSENRALLLRALGAHGMPLIVPNQVHGTEIIDIERADEASVALARHRAAEGSDALAVSARGVAALLCFADCVPVIIVSPTGSFVVAHAGWRGAVGRIASKSVRKLRALDASRISDAPPTSQFNAYIGPHIRRECFEVESNLSARFSKEFTADCAPDPRHVDLEAALRADLVSAGIDVGRIASAGVCTKCAPDEFFSYRASGGVCGRHGALAFRL